MLASFAIANGHFSMVFVGCALVDVILLLVDSLYIVAALVRLRVRVLLVII